MMKSSEPMPAPEVSQCGEDSALVERICAGEKELYAVLMRRYNQRVYRVVRGMLASDDEAEDVVQQGYVVAYHKLSTFRGEASFATWLTRICINEALGRIRQKGRHGCVALVDAGGVNDMADTSGTPEELTSRRELEALLEGHIDRLPDALRLVFVMREVEELSTEQTAEVLQISGEAVRVRLHRARKLLEQGLSEAMSVTPTAYRIGGQRCDHIVASVRARLGI